MKKNKSLIQENEKLKCANKTLKENVRKAENRTLTYSSAWKDMNISLLFMGQLAPKSKKIINLKEMYSAYNDTIRQTLEIMDTSEKET